MPSARTLPLCRHCRSEARDTLTAAGLTPENAEALADAGLTVIDQVPLLDLLDFIARRGAA